MAEFTFSDRPDDQPGEACDMLELSFPPDYEHGGDALIAEESTVLDIPDEPPEHSHDTPSGLEVFTTLDNKHQPTVAEVTFHPEEKLIRGAFVQAVIGAGGELKRARTDAEIEGQMGHLAYRDMFEHVDSTQDKARAVAAARAKLATYLDISQQLGAAATEGRAVTFRGEVAQAAYEGVMRGIGLLADQAVSVSPGSSRDEMVNSMLSRISYR